MPLVVLLDAGVVGLLVSSPHLPAVAEALAWLDDWLGRADVVIPDIAAYEVARELLRIDASAKLSRLDKLRSSLVRAEVTGDAWMEAARFWSLVRRGGKPTASPEALDADAILAAVAAQIGTPGDAVVIATTNLRHLTRFPGVDARHWR